jgi:hypothetical protein
MRSLGFAKNSEKKKRTSATRALGLKRIYPP